METEEQKKQGSKIFLISAVILTRNEEEKIEDCLKSLGWVNEIVVVDNSSTDKTIDIAKKYNVKVVKCTSKRFDTLRNAGTNAASGKWVLHIDSDERITSDLKTEIELKISASPSDEIQNSSYAIPRKNFVFGKEMRHCGLWPDYVQHLFRKDKFIKWKGILHETPEVEGKTGYLKNPLLHLKHEDLSGMIVKTNEWSGIEAKLMYEAKHADMNIFRFTSAMLREFWLRMIKQTAFLDGGEGIIYGFYQIWSRFVSYAKLWEMQNMDLRRKE